jgi:hypothetical protein
MSANEWVKSIPQVLTAVRITIVPPWKIADVPNHAAVNLGALSFVALLYLFVRVFTPPGAYGLTDVGVVAVLTSAFLLLCGIVVNFFDPTTDAVMLSNRWSTFLIVNFMLSLFLMLLMLVAVPVFTNRNLIDWLADSFAGGNKLAYLVSTFVASAASMGLLFWRTRRWFKDIIEQKPQYFYVSMLFCAAINWAVLFASVYVI